MSAKKNSSILSFFSRKPKVEGACTTPKPQTPNQGDGDKKQDESLHKSQEESELDDLTKSCLEDDDLELSEPVVVEKKRKRIIMADSSDEEDANGSKTSTPNKKTRLSERNGSTPIFSTPKNAKKTVDKENSSPPSSSKKLKDKLSHFASPTLAKSKSESDSARSEEAATKSLAFPHTTFAFLDPAKIMDKSRRRPDHPDYDPSTLYVPESFMKDQTPAQKQWWDFKTDHYDKVLFFKMGKFYELFHMDAVIAVERCGLLYMKKEMAHCGFPEVAFERYAEVLVDLGYKVARIEQTETPADLDVRVKAMSRPTKFDKVVRREICQITSSGTRINGSKDTNYLVAIRAKKSDEDIKVGICLLESSVGKVGLCHFSDDKELSCLETLLAFHPPIEILFDRSSQSLLGDVLGKFTFISARSYNFPDASKTLKSLHDYFGGKQDWPQAIADHHLDESDTLGLTPKKSSEMILSSLGAVINYLRESMIDHTILEQKHVENIPPPVDITTKLDASRQYAGPSNMILDNKTIKNLDLLPNPGQPQMASLFSVVDKTLTPMGRRLLKQWLCMPLMRIADIIERQEVIKFFQSNVEIVQLLKNDLKGLPDFEKLVSSIHASGIKLPSDHPEQRAIYYENAVYASKKVARLLTTLEALEKVQILFKTKLQEQATLFWSLLVEPFPDISEVLDYFKDAFDHKKAVDSGKIIPKKGVDPDFDQAKKDRRQLEQDLEDYLKDQKRFFGSSDIKYFGSGNNMYQIEVPESVANKKVNSDYTLSSQRKGFKRFTTDETRDFLARQVQVDEDEAEALAEVNRKIFCKFSEHKQLWETVVRQVSLTDALLSLYFYSSSLGDDSCFPEFQEQADEPYLKFVQGRHPIVTAANPDLAFIPNDFELDGQMAILTGANMGGKSTLMRQTALLAILAQVGAKVPASAFKATPVDRVFTRIGASDNIFDRESTFFVELLETRIILKYATNRSLVLIDELGRGTTTFDGCAIAHAVAKFLTQKKSRTLFSTHYHELMREFVARPDMKVYHMSVMEESEEDVVFMYTVASGPCSKSHGFNAAKMAGMPPEIINLGMATAEKFESEQGNLMKMAQILG